MAARGYKWTDEAAEALLQATADYKAQEEANGIDWESSTTKYSDIRKKLCDVFIEENKQLGSERRGRFSIGLPSQLSVTNKLKQIRHKYRKSIKEGSKSGNGRVVFLYFELCEHIWGGCSVLPPVMKVPSDLPSHSSPPTPLSQSLSRSAQSTVPLSASISPSGTPATATVVPLEDHEMIQCEAANRDNGAQPDQQLQCHTCKSKKLKRKLGPDEQTSLHADEEVDMKKQVLNKLDSMNKEHEKTITTLLATLDRMASSLEILAKFATLNAMQPQFPVAHQEQRSHCNQQDK